MAQALRLHGGYDDTERNDCEGIGCTDKLAALFDRDKPLAKKTLAEIEWGLQLWQSVAGDPALRGLTGSELAAIWSRLRGRVSARLGRQISPSTAVKIQRIWRTLLLRAAEAGLLERRAIPAVDPVPRSRPKPDFSLDAARQLYQSLIEKEPRAYIAFLCYTGWRSGCVHTLPRSAWDAARGLLLPPVGSRTKREELVAVHPRLAADLAASADGTHLFPGLAACSAWTMRRLHAKWQRAAGILAPNTLHAWRRTHTAWMAQAGADFALSVASGSVGHSSAQITRRHYCDVYAAFRLRLPDLAGDLDLRMAGGRPDEPSHSTDLRSLTTVIFT